MDTTIILARISGFICLLLGLSIMNKKFMAGVIDELLNSKALFWFIGFVAAVIGTIMLAFYSTWNAHWPVLITILGWLALLKGIAIMLMPGYMNRSVYRKFKTSGIIMFSGIIGIIFGLILLYKGFMA
jgi:threonine/homoserine/homoserine lactone efflux protein